MNSVRIVADSGCDLSPGIAAQYEITSSRSLCDSARR